jgi:hypothetical protein
MASKLRGIRSTRRYGVRGGEQNNAEQDQGPRTDIQAHICLPRLTLIGTDCTANSVSAWDGRGVLTCIKRHLVLLIGMRIDCG